MAYIGQRPVIGRYIKLDQISSGFNGSNTGFNMTAGSQAVFPGTARNLLLSLGGVIQEPDTDFTISGSTLTFTTPPVANTTFFGVIYGDMQATGTPSDGTVLPASIASSGHFKIPQLTVNEDGADVDFRVEGDTDANLLFVDASTDRVGIGTDAPAYKLELEGSGGGAGVSIGIQNTGAGPAGVNLLSGHGNWSIYNSHSVGDALEFRDESASTTPMLIDSSGNVGIGTSSPNSGKLHVTNTTGTIGYFESTQAATNVANIVGNSTQTDSSANLILQVNSGNTAQGLIRLEGNNSIVFLNGASPQQKARLDSSGRFLLGGFSTTRSVAGNSAKAQIESTDSQCISIISTSANSTGPQLALGKTRNGSTVNDDDSLGKISFAGDDGSDLNEIGAKIEALCDAATATNRVPARLEFYTENAASTMNLNMVITRDSQVFFPSGDTRDNMQSYCHSTADDFAFGKPSATADTGMTIVSNPSFSSFINFSDGSSGTRQGAIVYQHGSGTDKMFFRTNDNQNALCIDSSQNVGIGTTGPDRLLHIQGSGTDLVKIESTATSNLGSHLQLHHNSSSPADNDIVGAIEFSGKDTNGNATIYSRIRGVALDVTDGSEDGVLVIGTRANAGFAERMRIGENVGIGVDSGIDTKLFVQNTSGDAHLRLKASHSCGVLYTRTSDSALIGYTGSGGAVNLGSSNIAISASLAGGQIVFQTAGTASTDERMRIDSSGNVGIGTTSPDRKFDVSGTGNVYAKFQSTNATGAGIEVKDTGENWLIQADGGVGPGLAFYDLARTAYRMIIDSSGRVNIGLNSQSVSKLYVSGGSFSLTGSDGDFNGGGNRLFVDHDNNDVRFGFTGGGGSAATKGIRFYHCPASTGTAEATRITEQGEFRIGHDSNADSATSTDKVHSIGACNLDGVTTNLARLCMQERSGNWISFKDGGGTHYGTISRNGSNVVYGGQSSDYRIKENIVNVSNGITLLKQLRPVNFNYTADSGFTSEEQAIVRVGFIAHEYAEVCPTGVIGEKDGMDIWGDCTNSEGKTTQTHVPESKKLEGETWTEKSRTPDYQQIDFSKAVPILTAALQEAISKIETLETKVAALEAA